MDAMTIVIPNYNKGPFVKDTIDSLLRQTDPNWYALILDDGSTDESSSFLASYGPLRDPRFSVHFNRHRRGKAYCMNLLVDMAPTEIIGELDSDDVLTDDCVKKMRAAYRSTDAGLVYSNFVYCDERLTPMGKGYCAAIPEGGSALEFDCVSAFRTFRKSAYRKTTGFDESLTSAIDKDLIYKLEEVTPLFHVPQQLYLYRVLPDSLSLGPENSVIAERNHVMARARAIARRRAAGIPVRLGGPPNHLAGQSWARST